MQEDIIHYLKISPGYVSGEEISRLLKISRAGIWKYVQELRKDGYDIVAVPHLGYHLVSCPDKLLPREIQFQLGTKVIGQTIHYEDTLSSTMDTAFEKAVQGAKEGTVVIAETQSKGRGRLGRSWISPKSKGIYLSVILRPQLPPSNVAQLTLLSAVAVSEAVKKSAGIQPLIKWPNDLLIKDKKLAGILTELSAEMDRVRFVTIGLGINVNTPANLLPAHATSLKNETKQAVSRIVLTQEILRSLEKWYMKLAQEGFIPVLERWKEYSSTLGRRIKIVDPSGEVEGQAVDLDESGNLLIRKDSGMIVKKITGDVVHIR